MCVCVVGLKKAEQGKAKKKLFTRTNGLECEDTQSIFFPSLENVKLEALSRTRKTYVKKILKRKSG